MRVTYFRIATDYYFLRLHLLIRGERWRVRVRAINPWCWCKPLSEVFPEGAVHRIWLGPLLLVAMVDEAGKEHLAAARLARSRGILNRLMSDPSFGRQHE